MAHECRNFRPPIGSEMKRSLIFFLGILSWTVGAGAEEKSGALPLSEPVLLKELAGYKSLSYERSLRADEEIQIPLDADRKKKVSTFKAVGLSVLLPGSGHWYLGRQNRAKVFFGIEAAGWTSFAGFLWYSNQREGEDRKSVV